MVEPKKLLSMRLKDKEWHAERRRAENAFASYSRDFLISCAQGQFNKADSEYEDVVEAMNELLELAGVLR